MLIGALFCFVWHTLIKGFSHAACLRRPRPQRPQMFPNYGFAGGMPLAPQPTGFVDPRLQLMSSYLMPPSAMSSPFTATPTGMPSMVPPQQQFGGLSLQQSFQQHNQQTGMSAKPNLSWSLNKAEKKSYDQLFRQWDAQGTGFISGQTALEVFGQSGLDRNDLAKIWYVR